MGIARGSHVLNRKVGLLSKDREQHGLIESAFNRARELSNEITEYLFNQAFNTTTPSSNILERFQETSKSAQKKNIYEFYKFNRLNHDFQHDGKYYSLNKRVSRFVLDHAFFAVRNQLLKYHDLTSMIDVVIKLLKDAGHVARQNVLYHLISGTPVRFKERSLSTGKDIELFSFFSRELQHDAFEEVRKGKKAFSLPLFNNHFSHVRNLLLKQKNINPFFKNELKRLQKVTVTDLYPDIYKDVINDYTKKELDMEDIGAVKTLFELLLTIFMATIKRRILSVAKQKMRIGAEIRKYQKKSNPEKVVRLQKKLDRINNYTGIYAITNNLVYSTIPEFKKVRDKELDLVRNSLFSELSEKVSQLNLKDLLESITQEYIASLLQNPNHVLAKLIFAPTFSRIEIKGTTLEDLLGYFRVKLLYKVKEYFRNIFNEEPSLYTVFIHELNNMKASLNRLLKVPEIKGMSIPFVEKERYSLDLPNNKLQLHLISNVKLQLSINDKDKRIQKLEDKYEKMGYGMELKSPLVQLIRNKLVLNLPFEVQKKEDAPQQFAPDETVEMGIDLGLKVFGALSIIHHENDKEVREFARYFLNQRTVFDMAFQGKTNPLKRGSFVQREVLSSRTFQKEDLLKDGNLSIRSHLKYTNLKQKLVNIRREKRSIQSEISSLKNKHPPQFEKMSRYSYLVNKCEILDRRITNINTEIVHQVSSKIIQIALHHRIGKIKFEDLRWSRHSKKADVGHYIGFWQTHWFFSQIIRAVEVQARILGIQFYLVNARNTSKKCVFDNSLKPIAVRNGKIFTCSHEGHENGRYEVDADLNAARNIVMSEPFNTFIYKKFIACT